MAIEFNNAKTTIVESAKLHMANPKHTKLLLALALVGTAFGGGIKQAHAESWEQTAGGIVGLVGAAEQLASGGMDLNNKANAQFAQTSTISPVGYSNSVTYNNQQVGYQQGYVQQGYQQIPPQGVPQGVVGGYAVQNVSPSQMAFQQCVAGGGTMNQCQGVQAQVHNITGR